MNNMIVIALFRLFPLRHRMLHQLIRSLDLSIDKHTSGAVEKDILAYYLNTTIRCIDDYKNLYQLKEKDLPYYLKPANYNYLVNVPENGNIFEGTVGETGQKATDMNLQQYFSYAPTVGLLCKGIALHSLSTTVADVTSYIKQYGVVDSSNPLDGIHYVNGGMTSVIKQLVLKIESLSNVSLITGAKVVEVTEKENSFDVMTTSETPFEGKKLILACNK